MGVPSVGVVARAPPVRSSASVWSDFGLQVMGIDEVGSDSVGVLGAGPEGVQLGLCPGLSEHRGGRWEWTVSSIR